ncbi:MAG: homocysteine S-methyltransferase family protein [Pseudomonadales bacterium]|jgi:homocysteine S-methyltransferase|nr:homocysteine S-methyltransferase family protein [Pseudomonadales bacterium]HJN52823.1 homocysteine S-methyltransferase family protein [Pseudomonadales bacterium]|tara:strand:- start:490 stop:1452 length:963 start_codon:yes stop_codon:yes gene_type:complete
MILDSKLSKREIIVLDGAIGSEIARLGGVMDAAAWCGVANKTHPEVVRRVHEEYIRAGVDVVTANTFATCRHVLAGAGLADEAVSITARAVELAREAVNEVAPGRPVAVAGSMSNNVAWIPGTVSPDPRFLPTRAEEAANYREMAEALAAAGVDLILMEMMSDIDHASLVTAAAVETGLPVWIGVSCSLLADGSAGAWDMHTEEPADRLATDHAKPEIKPLAPVIDALMSFEPQVMGIMHSTVDAMGAGLEVLFQHWRGPVMAYPEAAAGHAVEPAAFAAYCRDWVEGGVQIIGGCCGTTIEHIDAMVGELPDAIGARPA